MNSNKSESTMYEIGQINPSDRWQVYQRLQALNINCSCTTGEPLKVEIHDPATAIQLWSVNKQITASRSELVHWLNSCWQIPTNIKD